MRITTTYVGPTDTKGSRIVAKGGGKQFTMPYDYSLNLLDLHAKAAAMLLRDRHGVNTLAKVQETTFAAPEATEKGYSWEVTL